LALVGESGSGKSTLARCLIRLHEVTDGTVRFAGQDITHMSGGEMRGLRREMQMIFQDPLASLNPRHRVCEIVAAPMRIHKLGDDDEILARVTELLERVGLGDEYAGRFPRELSGGQRQRVSVARALSVNPRLIVADEAVSALDVSIQAEVLNLFMDLQDETGMAYLFISHDLGVVRHFADRVAVMYHGKIVEQGPVQQVYENPTHPYTKTLLASVPIPDPNEMRARRAQAIAAETVSTATDTKEEPNLR
jgi:ABC-type oligopeptide transport system ATPase subunit